MKPIPFPGSNVVFAANQPEYLPLPAHQREDGVVTSCWELTDEEMEEVSRTHLIWFSVHTFNRPLQPQLPQVQIPAYLPQPIVPPKKPLAKGISWMVRLAKWYLKGKLP